MQRLPTGYTLQDGLDAAVDAVLAGRDHQVIALGLAPEGLGVKIVVLAAHPVDFADALLGFLPETMAREAIQKRQIVQIHLREEIPPRQICLVYDRQRPMSAAARQLKTTLLKERTD